MCIQMMLPSMGGPEMHEGEFMKEDVINWHRRKYCARLDTTHSNRLAS
jgi:hypothetical protein